jgi:hypothetical protein
MELDVRSVPAEFMPESISRNAASTPMFGHFLGNHRLEESLFSSNPWLQPPDFNAPLDFPDDRYWVTTVASEHPYWSTVDLPRPTKDLHRMRSDFLRWGYCLIEAAMSSAQTRTMHSRLLEQAQAERLAGIEQASPYGQYVNTLVNKGECFARAIEQDPEAVQGGPIIEQLLDEALGEGWICHAFLANGADPGGYPQALHIDQGALLPWMPIEAPALVNTLYVFEDLSSRNGGTLIIPGSHRAFIEAGTGGFVGKLPPAVNLDAPAGTVMVLDGRLLHGTGVNHTDKQRFVATMSAVKPWMRQQESWVLSVRPCVLEKASPKLLHRMGFQAVFNGGTVEGFGVNFAKGRIGEPHGALRIFRDALDRGNYLRVGELRPSDPSDVLSAPFTVRAAMAAANAMPISREQEAPVSQQ